MERGSSWHSFFRLISRRYEYGNIIRTSSKYFAVGEACTVTMCRQWHFWTDCCAMHMS